MSNVTEILQAIRFGDQQASESLLPLVYQELHRLAKTRLANESTNQTLQPTALVHEAYLRLVDATTRQSWNSKGHFFAAAAEAMRRILIENARRKQSLRHGGGRRRLDIENVHLIDPNDPTFLIDLNDALNLLEQSFPVAANVVNLRFFAGLSIDETADVLDVPVRTVNRQWAFSKAWLHGKLSEQNDDLPPIPV